MDDNKCVTCGTELDENGMCPNCEEEEVDLEEGDMDDDGEIFEALDE